MFGNYKRGKTGLRVTQEGEEWKYSAAFLGALLAVQPESVCGEREEEGGFLRGPLAIGCYTNNKAEKAHLGQERAAD